jgi:hypothetical protein
MECLYCRATLGLLSRGEFCNNKHRDQWREQQAELSIQRLIESFSCDKTAAEKSGSGSVSVLDWTSRDAVPPAALFAHRDSREEIKPPVTRAIRDASEKRGVFDHGSDSDRQAPPDAGFISTIDLNKGLHLPVFNRRPALSEKGLNNGFDSNLINRVLRAIDARYERRRFIRPLSVSSTEGCQARLFGHSAPRPFLDLSDGQNLCKARPVQLRSLATFTCAVPGRSVQACALQPEASQLTLYSGPQSTYAVPPMALLQRETLPTPVTVPSKTIVAKLARLALGAAIEPLHSPAPSGFQALPAGQILRGQFTQLQFQACQVAHPVLHPCELEPRPWQARVPTAAVGSYEVRPVHLHTREVESRSTRTQRPKIGQASLPQSAATQPVGYTQAPQAFALTVGRTNPAPRNCGFYALAPERIVSTRATSVATSRPGMPQQPLAQQLQPRQFGFACCRVLVTPVEGFARNREKPTALQSAGKRSSEVSLTALCRREMPERTAPLIPYTSSPPSLQAGAAQVQRRKLDFRPSQVFTTTRTTPIIASRPEKLETKEYAASSQLRQPRRIALRSQTATRKPVFARHVTTNPVLARPTTPPLPSAVQIRAQQAFGITSGRTAPVLPNCSFHALATRFGASPMDSQIRTTQLGSGQTVAIRIYARDLRLTSAASMLFDSPVFLGAELSSQRPKFVAKGFDFDYKIGVPSQRLPAWDPERTPCLQFPANPNSEKVALVGSSRVARTLTWALPGTRLHLELHAREIAAAAYPSTGTKPAGGKGDLKWVAHKIPWVPMP